MRRTQIIPAVMVLFAASGCAAGETVEATTSVTATTTITHTVQPTEPASTQPTVPVGQAEQSVVAEPNIDHCLEGVAGPTLMSDGSVVYTDYCWDLMDGDRMLEAEREANSPEKLCALGDANACAQVPYANGGTCPAYRCGYGTDANGNPNPSSGEIQTAHGCQQGYVTDQALCDAVRQKAERYGWDIFE